jgi:hypothetical protein
MFAQWWNNRIFGALSILAQLGTMALGHDIKIINTLDSCRTASKEDDNEKSLVQLLSVLRPALREIVSFFKDQATTLREQHGGITTHDSITDIMNKIGDCVDKTA